MRSRRAAALGPAALLVAAALTAGCGDGAAPSTGASTAAPAPATTAATSPAPTTQATDLTTGDGVTAPADVAGVRQTMQRYVDAFIAADGDTACALLSDESAAAFVTEVGESVGETTCPAAFAAVAGQLPADQRDAFRTSSIRDVSVTGGAARGTLTVDGVSSTFTLVRAGAAWRIANLPGQ